MNTVSPVPSQHPSGPPARRLSDQPTRPLRLPPLTRYPVRTDDGVELALHRARGGDRGPVILSAGTAMAGRSFCLTTTAENLVEHLVARGFDVWMFDWRTSPELAAHAAPYTMDEVARFDWPAAVAAVRAHTGAEQVAVMAHCMSASALLLSLVRNHLHRALISRAVCSQVGLHLVQGRLQRITRWTFADRLAPREGMLHFRPHEVTGGAADRLLSLLAATLPVAHRDEGPAWRRLSATFGALLHLPQTNPATRAALADLVPEVHISFIQSLAPATRAPASSLLGRRDMRRLDRLALPITFLVGAENRTFPPRAARRTIELLRAHNDPSLYRLEVVGGFGHLDCLIGDDALSAVYPLIAAALEG